MSFVRSGPTSLGEAESIAVDMEPGEEEEENAWDDRALIDAYERSVSSFKKGSGNRSLGKRTLLDGGRRQKKRRREVQPGAAEEGEVEAEEDGEVKKEQNDEPVPPAPPAPEMPEGDFSSFHANAAVPPEVRSQLAQGDEEANALEALVNSSYWLGYNRGAYDQIRKHRK